MVRRPLRSYFSTSDQAALIEAMRAARDWTNRLSASISPTSERAQRCHALQAAIDQLAGDLTGDPRLFALQGHSELARPPKG